MGDIRFMSMEDGDLADIWYAVGGAAVRHTAHFKPLFDAIATELLARRGEGLTPWLDHRFREFRRIDAKEDALASAGTTPDADESEPLPDQVSSAHDVTRE